MKETKYTPLFRVHQELRRLVEANWNQIELRHAPQGISSFILGKAHKTHQAILVLCDKGFGQDAAILARSLFELEVTLLYILADNSQDRARRFINYDFVLRLKRYEYARTQEDIAEHLSDKAPDEGWDTLRKCAQDAQNEFQYKDHFGWSDKSFRGMAEEVGLLRTHDTVYRLLCDIAHSGSRTMNEYMSESAQAFTIETGQSEIWLEESLVASFDFYFHIVEEWQEVFSLSLLEELAQVEKSWGEAFNSRKRAE